MTRPIYLDNAATTVFDPRVVARMAPYLYERFGNAASHHRFGWSADEAVEIARESVAALIGCRPEEIVWTSGATESNSLALCGMISGFAARGRHVISVATEHVSVLDTLQAAAARGEIELTLLPVDRDGLVSLRELQQALRPDTELASVMWVNNETGAVQDIAAIAALCAARGICLHVDATQAVGKIDIDLARIPVGLMSMSAHKIHGPQGIGALFVRESIRPRLMPRQVGGGQERGLRAGTLPVHQIVGLGEACRLARQCRTQDLDRVHWLRNRLLEGLQSIDGVTVNGDPERTLPHLLNVQIAGTEAAVLLERLAPELALSAGSACSSSHVEPSHVLRAMGLQPAEALASLRLSLGRFTQAADIDAAVASVTRAVTALRSSATTRGAAETEDEDCPMKRMRRRAAQRSSSLNVPVPEQQL